MLKVSVVIITYNEKDNVQDALESAGWADEVVVLDSLSTDGTPEICRRFTDKVYQEKWRGFAMQKQRAVELATNDWVFVLDADERFTDPLKAEIRTLMEMGPESPGYRVPRKNHFMGKFIRYGGWYPDYSVRLFDRTRGRFGTRNVHEAVELDAAAGTLKNPMLHYTYKDVSDYIERMERYSTLIAKDMDVEGRRAGVLDLTLRPLYTFFKMYVLKQGIRDGYHGLLLAGLYACYTYVKYAKLWEIGRTG
jgi:glycosyltransferase involved in cell wall biosynthesis